MFMEASAARTFPCDGNWHPIFKGDKATGLTASGDYGFPKSSTVVARLYVNVSGLLLPGFDSGVFEIQAVRRGTTNDTANLDRPVKARDAAGNYMARHTHPLWIGANPGGFRWEIRSTSAYGLKTMVVRTRHIKHYGLAVVH